jgi:large subunit ribosomal protein L17
MRHNVAHRKLGRVTEHRLALLRNQAIALLRHEHIETTLPKAKELRPFVERLITIAKRGVAAGEANGKALHARRMVLAELPDKDVVGKLFETIAPRFAERPGGYTRILRVGFRRGDSAEVAQVELVGSEYDPRAAAEKQPGDKDAAAARPKTKGVGDRLKAAAQRMRGSKGDQGGSKAQAGGQTKGKAQKSTTPRKAGGS